MAATAPLPDPAARADELRHLIEEANYSYHVLDNPTISDSEYDQLTVELREIEAQYPELRTDDSPTQQVGGRVGQGFRPRIHPVPMLSLANAFSHEELDRWLAQVRRLVPDADIDFVVEPKIDGLAIALTYHNGAFRVGATRGNGVEGEDVTANLRTVKQVPHRLLQEPIPERVEVRGEIYLPISGFEELNNKRAEEGLSLFANPRNAAAGSLRQLDPEVTRGRPLCLFAYSIGYADGLQVSSQWQALQLLKGWGFPVNELAQPVRTVEEVHAFGDRIAEERDRLGYEIDGVVVKINSVALQEELGVVGATPRWARAFKFPSREGTTRLLAIEVNVGRTGTINPYAVLEPVSIGGVTVQLATLHNEQDIQRKDIRVGDWVIVRRAGDVIPQVVKPVPEKRDGSQQVYCLPVACPACGTAVVREASEAMSRCPNMECPAQRFRWIEHFVSEGAMDIRGLGERLVQLLLDHELIKDPADLYSLALDQLLALPKFQEKSANNLLSSIERSKRRPLPNVIFALGIRYVGYETAQLLAEEMGGIDALVNAPVERLEAGDGIGRKTAESIAEWAARLQTQDFLRRLKAAGVSWEAERSESSSGPLAGKCFLLTGRLEGMSRPQAEARLRDLGAKIASGMNKSVDYLIVGADPGSKLERARKLGTSIRDEEWLVKLLATGALPQDD